MTETIHGIEAAILEATLEDIAALPPEADHEQADPLRLQAAVAANAIHAQAVQRIQAARLAGRPVEPQPIPRAMRMPRAIGQETVVAHMQQYVRLGIQVAFDDRDETVCHLQSV